MNIVPVRWYRTAYINAHHVSRVLEDAISSHILPFEKYTASNSGQSVPRTMCTPFKLYILRRFFKPQCTFWRIFTHFLNLQWIIMQSLTCIYIFSLPYARFFFKSMQLEYFPLVLYNCIYRNPLKNQFLITPRGQGQY